MKNLFAPDSKVIRILTRVADNVFLNLLFVLLCLPVVTIGAAQTGLMRASRVQLEAEKTESCYRAFFRGFREGFGRITLLWLAALVLGAGLYVTASVLFFRGGTVFTVAGYMAGAALLLILLLQPLTAALHARFVCTGGELLKNAIALLLLQPLHAVGLALLVWLPLLVLRWNLVLFVKATPLLLFFYFSVAFQLGYRMLRPQFAQLEANYRAEHGEQPPEA